MNLKPRKQRRTEQGSDFVPIPCYAGNGHCVHVQYEPRENVNGTRWQKVVRRIAIDPETCAHWFTS